ncbi:MAG TPA: MBL fold metallo-hydrolase [bacterium]|nr:MBL fold metallo-hydrolase [bacterium]
MGAAEERGDLVATRRIGDATIAVISEGTLVWTPKMQAPAEEVRRAIPELTDTGTLTLGLNLAHVALGDASIVIDPGCDDPESSWQKRFAAKWPGVRRSAGLRAGLARLGVGPAEVTHVLITHAHADHFAGVTVERDGRDAVRFPRATHLIGRKDWIDNPARHDPDSELAVRLGAIDRAGLLGVVEEEREVAPGVAMILAPGETPGHCVVRIRTAGESFYYVGDLFHHACEVAHPDWVPANRDVAATHASRIRTLAEAATSAATVVFSHERFPAWGRIAAAGGAFRWERAW